MHKNVLFLLPFNLKPHKYLMVLSEERIGENVEKEVKNLWNYVVDHLFIQLFCS